MVKNQSFMSANEDFNILKTAVLKKSDEIPAQRQYAPLAWEFVLGFAHKKTFFRSHVCQVISALLADPSFRHAYASNSELRKKASEQHPEVKECLDAVDAVEEVVPKKVEMVKPRITGKEQTEVEWPDWEAMEATVRLDHFMGANEEFRLLRLAILAADPVQLASQVARAEMVWQFLAGFGEVKSHFRSQMAEVIGILRQENGWEEALDAVRPKIQDRLKKLPEILQTAMSTDHAEAERASRSASFCQEEVAEDSQTYSSPSFESLQDRLKSLSVHMANLGQTQSEVKPMEAEAPPKVQEDSQVENSPSFESLQDRLTSLSVHMSGLAKAGANRNEAQVLQQMKVTEVQQRLFQQQEPVRMLLATAKSLLLTEGSANLLENIEHQQKSARSISADLMEGKMTLEKLANLHEEDHQIREEILQGVQHLVEQVESAEAMLTKRHNEAEKEIEIEKLLKQNEQCQPAMHIQTEKLIPVPLTEPFDKAAALLEKAKTLEGEYAVIGHYLRVYALELLITAKQAGQSKPEADQMMLETLQMAESKKGQLDLANGPAQFQAFILQIYDEAVLSDSLEELLNASLLLETLSQFYGSEVIELGARASYLQLRSQLLTSCLQQGKTPAVAKPPSLAAPTLPGVSKVPPAPAQPKPTAMPPVKAPVPQPKQDLPPEIAGMPRSKRQAEARKKADQASSALKAGQDDTAKACIREALGLLEGL